MNFSEAKPLEIRLMLRRYGVWLLVLTVLFLYAAFLIARAQDFMRNGDFFEYWLAGKFVWEGKSMYDPAVWEPPHAFYGNFYDKNPVFPYPPILALFFAPLGVGSLAFAAVGWVFISEVLILAAVAILLLPWRSQNISLKPYFLPLLMGVFLFRPVMVTLRNGQLGALFLALLALCVYFWERKKWFWGGVCLAVIVLRPNLGVPILGLVGLWLLWKRQWRAIAGIGVAAVVMLGVSFLIEPNWLQGMLSVGNEKIFRTFGYHPVVWGLTFMNCGLEPVCGWTWGGIAALGMTLLAIWGLWKNRASDSPALSFSLLLSLALWLAPYLWAYDQALLVLPVVTIAGMGLARQWPYLLTATATILFSVFALILLAVSIRVGNDAFGSLLSAGTLLVLSLSKWPASIFAQKTFSSK